MTFIAQYRGYCNDCGDAIEVGAQCTYDTARRIIHAPCPEGIDDSNRAVCPSCWLVLPCDCEVS